MPKYIFKMVWVIDAFDDAEARHICKRDLLEELDAVEIMANMSPIKVENIFNPYRVALNKAGSDENILRRGA